MKMLARLVSGRTAVALVVVAAALVVAVPGSAMPAAAVSFLGMGHTATSSIITGDPPDPTGAVGPNDYVEAVNSGIEVFNKSGGILAAAKSLNALWSGYTGTNPGNGCATRNDGDPIVRYDRLADRWLITQFSLPNQNTTGGPSFQCVAVSKTGDPTGAYWRYDFKYPYAINDYAKVGVWRDAYYATFNIFDRSGGVYAYKGVDICAWDRSAMLNGNPASQQCFLLPYPSEPACPAAQSFAPFGILPANADGSLPPPNGSPEYLMQFDYSQCSGPYNQLDLWKLHIDWTTPANSALSGPTALTVSNFMPACFSAAAPNCIPQPGSTTKIDGLDDRLMDRLVYRNFGTYESLYVNHTVTGGAGAGIRWYEIHSPDTTPTVYQQGTYAPADSNWRWMGSVAADQARDIALGYSVSASSGGVAHPAIAWTGRLGTDGALGTMTQGETVLQTGAANAPDDSPGPPDEHRARWGDYTSMTVDPSDDCTFWYVNEVEPVLAAFSWDTYIQSFKFPNCAQNDFTVAPTGSVTALQGSSGSTTISTALSRGTAETVQLTAFDLPQGATASFSPSTVAAGGSSTLTLAAGANTPAGIYTVEAAGTAASAVHGTTVTFTVKESHTLTVSKSPAGVGTVTSGPAGIDCGSTCSLRFASGTPVTLSASPAAGSVFLNWSGDCSGSNCTTTMDADHGVTANFDAIPSCTDGAGLTSMNTPVQLALSCSDPDGGDPLSYSLVAVPSHGMLGAIDSGGHVGYTPFGGYTGSDSFTFKVTDSHGVNSSTARVNLTVQVAAPTCANRSTSSAHNTAVVISLPCSAAGAITYSIVSPPSHGTLGTVSAAGRVPYRPASGFGGTDAFTFKATDTHGQPSNVARARITVGPNHAPSCSNQTISVRHNTAKRVVLGCSDADPRNTLHRWIVTHPSHGTLSAIGATGTRVYKPKSGFGGLDRFTFKATDNEGAHSNIATINLHVARRVPCAGLTGEKLRACKAKLELTAALERCARFKNKTRRTACIKAAKRTYRRAPSARVGQALASGRTPRGHRPPPLLVYRLRS